MATRDKGVTILFAEDDAEDRMLVKEALAEARLGNDVRFVEDGEELLDYLHHRGRFVDPVSSPRPGVILLDLNMPRKDGREVIPQIKEDPKLRNIPIVVLTTSKAEEDVLHSYEAGASGFITKPVTFTGLVEAMAALKKYWFEIVQLPPAN